MVRFFAIMMLAIFASVQINAWEGFSYEKGSYIEIDSYDHQGIGEGDVEYFDYSDGQYHTGYLDMYPGGTGEITDEDGNKFEVEMD
jgi:hypothetical protein